MLVVAMVPTVAMQGRGPVGYLLHVIAIAL